MLKTSQQDVGRNGVATYKDVTGICAFVPV